MAALRNVRRVCALASIGLIALQGTAAAQDDPLATGTVLEFSIGAVHTMNTLQDQLTTPNNASLAAVPGPTIASTSLLDIGNGARVDLSFSRNITSDLRGFVDISFSETSADQVLTLASSAFPGSFDDGFLIVGGDRYAFDFEHRTLLASAGVDFAEIGGVTIGAGIQAGLLEQSSLLVRNAGARIINVDATNRMFGVMVRASDYTSLSDRTGVRFGASLGVLANSYDYDFLNSSGGGVDQQASASGETGVISYAFTARLEHALSAQTFLTMELGVEGFSGIVNGFDTFLDFRGRETSAFVERGVQSESYLSVGVAHRF